MKTCQLCGKATKNFICSDCAERLEAGFHPVICALCRDLFGDDYAFIWMPEDSLSNGMRNQLVQSRAMGNHALFMRPKCETCEGFTNETITSIRMSTRRVGRYA